MLSASSIVVMIESLARGLGESQQKREFRN